MAADKHASVHWEGAGKTVPEASVTRVGSTD